MTTSKKYDTATPFLAAYILLRDGNKIPLVLRSNTRWMDGYYGLLSGKVEWGESFTAAAIREAREEGGVTIKPEHLKLKLIVQRHSDDSDWVDAIFEASQWEGEVYNAEPQVHSELSWHDIDNIPENTLPDIQRFLQAIAEGKQYIELDW
jgi:8-oxo-dGTP diphosphatase